MTKPPASSSDRGHAAKASSCVLGRGARAKRSIDQDSDKIEAERRLKNEALANESRALAALSSIAVQEGRALDGMKPGAANPGTRESALRWYRLGSLQASNPLRVLGCLDPQPT